MRQFELVERVQRYNPNADEGLLNKAYVYAMKAHGHQKRASGAPYISHPLEVAGILTELRLDDATIAAALLHDTVEDTDATIDEIQSKFGDEIANLVDGLTKINKYDRVTREAAQAENLRKLLLAMAEDIRVLLIKLADRLHNMRTLGVMRDDKRKRIAEETMELYAPLAGRMGIQWMRDELEDLAFIMLQPEAYAMITGRLTSLRVRSDLVIDEITTALQKRLDKAGITAKISGREKRPYSIWRKLESKSLSFEKLSDIYGFRVIVDDIPTCYQVVGLIHTTWPMVPERFKDYISTPKQNDYQSIHTTVLGPHHQRVELQIRTHGMHEIADYGIAAHALYKDAVVIGGAERQANSVNADGDPGHKNGKVLQGDTDSSNGGKQPSAQSKNQKQSKTRKQANGQSGPGGREAIILSESRSFRWLRALVDTLSEGEAPEEVLEHTKLELFQDQVFCFTPKSRIIALPRGATALDFAYAVHTDVGNHAVGCRINGRHEPMISVLSNGDEVEILTSENQTPSPAWHNVAKTGKAKQAIRRATRLKSREQYSGLGREIVERQAERLKRSYSDEKLATVLFRLGYSEVDDVLVAVGRGELDSKSVVKAIYPDSREEARAKTPAPKPEEGWFGVGRSIGLKFRLPGFSSSQSSGDSKAKGNNPVPIRGIQGDLPVQFAPDGGAVPGDRIVGIVEPGQGITIYPIQSPELKRFDDEPERWLDVRWDIDADSQERFPAQIGLRVLNEPGALAEIAQIIGEQDGNIDAIMTTGRQADFVDMVIDVGVWDLRHLNGIMALLKSASAVNSVWRVNG